MTQSSPADPSASQGDWYRSPFALLAGGLLFLGAIIAIVSLVSGGDDVAETAIDTVPQAAPPQADEPQADAPAEPNPPKPAASAPVALTFGGDDILEVNEVIVDGVPLPPVDPDGDTALGTLAPTITASSLANGNPITLGPGRARVIGFFAHWCPHCQAELPQVTAWLAANELPPNTEFIAVSTAVAEDRGNYPPSAWFTDVGFGAPVVVDDANGSLLGAFGVTGFPAFVAIDASGVVVARSGALDSDGLATLFTNFAS